jgi:hypothetical protein
MEKLKNMKYIKGIRDAAKEATDKLRKSKAKGKAKAVDDEEDDDEADQLNDTE